jgi:hypothetical protein
VQMATSIGYPGMLNWLRSAMGKLKIVEELFKGRHFDREVVIVCVRWYLRFKLGLRDLGRRRPHDGASLTVSRSRSLAVLIARPYP